MKFELLTRVMNTYCWYLDCSRPTVERSDSSNNPLHKEAMISQLRVQTKQCHSIVSFFFPSNSALFFSYFKWQMAYEIDCII